MIEFSGIFSAIIITYIISKIFQIRQEKLSRKSKIIYFSNKITDFRRIARILVNSYNFWDQTMRQKMDNDYKELTHFHLRIWDYENEELKYPKKLIDLRNNFYAEKNLQGSNLYLDLKSLVLDNSSDMQLYLYNRFNYGIEYNYNLVEKWSNAYSGHMLWDCFAHKKSSYNGAFNFSAILNSDKEEILELAIKIGGKKYSSRAFSSYLLADVAGDMESFYFPKLLNLVYLNSLPFSSVISFMMNILSIVIFIGVIVPLLISAINYDIYWGRIVMYLSIFILTITLLYFMLKMKSIFKYEITV